MHGKGEIGPDRPVHNPSELRVQNDGKNGLSGVVKNGIQALHHNFG